MSLIFVDRVKESSTSTGTGNFTLAGAVTGFKTFNSTVGVGNRCYYAIVSSTGAQWEVGLGYLSNATTFVREAVYATSAGSFAVNFSAGTKNVFLTLPANTGSNTIFANFVEGDTHTYSELALLGNNIKVSGGNSTALGGGNVVVGASGVAVGNDAQGGGVSFAYFGGSSAVAVGPSARAIGSNSVAIGSSSLAASQSAATDSVAIGSSATASGGASVAIGNSASTDISSLSVAIGSGTFATNSRDTAVGSGSNAYGSYSVALGSQLTASQPDQLVTRVRVNPSGVDPTVYELKYDNTAKEIYATTGGGGGGVTQIIAGPGISISPAGGTGIVTISTGGGAGFDWFQRDPSPVDGSIATPTIFTNSPSGSGYLMVAGFTNAPFSPSGAPWNPASSGGWFGQVYYLSSFGGWSSLSSPYSYAPGASQGVAFNYAQYPAGHSAFSFQNVFGSAFGWSSNFGGSFGVFYPSPPGTGKKLYGVLVISSGGTDLSGVVSVNPAYPGTEFTAYYDSYSGATVIAYQNPVDSEVFTMLDTGASFIGWGGSYSIYGHSWYEYN